jgi:esterase/lipase superfamily enzyme
MAMLKVRLVGWLGLILTLFVAVCLCGGGCSPKTSKLDLMPTPNLYVRGDFDPFADVPPGLRSNGVDVIYVTDRKPEEDLPDPHDAPQYGYERSRSTAFGVSRVEFGKDVSWDELAKASRSSKRDIKLPVRVVKTTEVGRMPPTPRVLIKARSPAVATSQASAATATPAMMPAADDPNVAKAEQLLSEHLARTPVKDVYIYIHGYASTFDDASLTVAQLWHFFGRQGVPIAYTWPAGHGGLLKGYTYDRESSEFTVYHLKEMIRHIAENPDVHKIHIIAHSRGTDVAINALRELHLEIEGRDGKSTRDVLKLGTLVLAAPDVDFDVLVQRTITARLGQVPEQSVIYVSASDRAVGLSNWLFGGTMRLGVLQSNVFSAQELTTMRDETNVAIVQAKVSEKGSFGHDYFFTSPAVSSDLVLAARYHCRAGAEFGRPLKIENGGFWMIDDAYPTPVPHPSDTATSGANPQVIR